MRFACIIWMGLTVLTNGAVAQDVASWDAERSDYFSDLCMATAPSFAGLGPAAVREGFAPLGQGLARDEVNVSLLDDGATCTCYMTMGAPNPDSLVVTMFQRLLSEFPDGWSPSSQGGTVNDTTFVRDGVPVRLILRPAALDGAYWLDARVVAQGPCSR